MSDTLASRLYGISSGNGNDGVSHTFADYYVRTNDPWRLAELAILAEFKPKGWAWAKKHAEIDGEAEYTISAVIDAPPCEDSEDGEYSTQYVCSECDHISDESSDICSECGAEDSIGEREYEDYEDGRNWSDGNGAWLIVEVFPASEDDTRDRPIYDSLEDAFSSNLVATVAA